MLIILIMASSMDLQLILIALFAFFGCSFFILFLAFFHKALQPASHKGTSSTGIGGSSSHINHAADIEVFAQQSFIPIISPVEDDDKVLLTDTALLSSLGRSTCSNNSLAACQYSSNLYFMKRLSRSLTAERSTFIQPCILREFSVTEIESATAKFSSSNIIKHGHSGDIFKGVLGKGDVVVIKHVKRTTTTRRSGPKVGYNLDRMLSNISINKDYYAAEMDVYGKILNQTFFVPVLGQCLTSPKEKFIVYEYMPYGDLASILTEARAHANNVLQTPEKQPRLTEEADYEENGDAIAGRTHTSTTTATTGDTNNMMTTPCGIMNATAAGGAMFRILTWPARKRIARQVAKALVFLHHESRPPLSHRNIQGSSILLNKDFEVKLGSLGDAQKIESGELPTYDIYCFGRLLLDLISGLDISGNGRDEAVQAWISKCFHALMAISSVMSFPPLAAKEQYQLPHYINNLFNTELIDRNLVPLMQEHYLLEIIQVAHLAKLCMQPTTALQKLNMKGVLDLLPSPTKMP